MNKYNRGRNIPSEVKREVRQRCGLGCVICGNLIYDYDHFNPPYAEAEEHDADGIILLCSNHHSRKTRRLLPDELIREYALNPICKRQGYENDNQLLCLSEERPVILIGSNQFSRFNYKRRHCFFS